MGSIEVGKIANLTVTRGDILDRTTRVTNVFIDGRPVDLRPATPAVTPPADAAAPGPSPSVGNPEETRVNFTGTWTISMNISGQNMPGTLVLRQEGGAISGSMTTQLGTAEFSGGSVTGNAIHVIANATIQGRPMELTIDAAIQGEDINGTVQSALGTVTFSGSRQP